MNGQADVEVDYKRKYKNLKRKLKFLVYVSAIISCSGVDTNTHVSLCVRTDVVFGFRFPGAGMLPGGAEESTEKTSQSFQGQKVRLYYYV